MSNKTNYPNSVITVSFAHDEDAYGALTKLRELENQNQLGLCAAARTRLVETAPSVSDR
jgi:hypothetical protein